MCRMRPPTRGLATARTLQARLDHQRARKPIGSIRPTKVQTTKDPISRIEKIAKSQTNTTKTRGTTIGNLATDMLCSRYQCHG